MIPRFYLHRICSHNYALNISNIKTAHRPFQLAENTNARLTLVD